MARVTIIVLDSFGVGALPDAADYGDAGASTLGHIKEHMGRLDIPHMVELGLYSIDGLGLGAEAPAHPTGCYGKCAEKSHAKDTTNGHFEIAGLVVEKPFRVFGEHFPDRIIRKLESRIGDHPGAGR